jgi:hypothetical protein
MAWRQDPSLPLWRRASAGNASAWCQSWQPEPVLRRREGHVLAGVARSRA